MLRPCTVSESQGYGRVVCLSTRKILEKLKSLCSLSGLPGIEKGALIENFFKSFFGGPASLRGWWKELLHTLPGDMALVEEARETT